MKYSTRPMIFNMETQKIFIFVIIILRINLTSQALYPIRYVVILRMTIDKSRRRIIIQCQCLSEAPVV